MANKINITIPQPCHENWQVMSNVKSGKFCASCQKNVIDFTTLSDKEIIKSFEKNDSLCGRFLKTQLNRDLTKPKEKSSIWLASTVGFISFIGFGNQEVFSQEKIKTQQTDKKTIDEDLSTKKPNQVIKITGLVTHSIDSMYLPGVNVYIKGTSIKTQTDFDGNFTIQAKEGDILIFSLIGLKTREIKISKKYNLDVKMEEEEAYILENVIMGGYCVGVKIEEKKRTFFGRTFHSFGNWFK